MPRFYFNVDGDPVAAEINLESVAIAKCEAIKLAGSIISDEARKFWTHAQWGLTVTDEKGLTLFHIEITGTESPAVQACCPLPVPH